MGVAEVEAVGAVDSSGSVAAIVLGDVRLAEVAGELAETVSSAGAGSACIEAFDAADGERAATSRTIAAS